MSCQGKIFEINLNANFESNKVVKLYQLTSCQVPVCEAALGLTRGGHVQDVTMFVCHVSSYDE